MTIWNLVGSTSMPSLEYERRNAHSKAFEGDPASTMSSTRRPLFAAFLLIFALCAIAIKWLKPSAAEVIYGAVVAFVLHEIWWKRRQLPAGPLPWLTLGNMVSLISNSFDELMAHWRHKYGGIFTVWIGPFPLVMVNEINTLKRFFVQNGDVFSDRWRNFVTDSFMGGDNGLIQVDGPKWREQRRFALHVLRNFGVGQHRMEHKIMCEVRQLISYLDSQDELSLTTPIAVCVGNIINDMLFGVTFPQGSAEMKQLHDLLDTQSRLVINPLMGLYIACPFTTKIPLINRPWLKLMELREGLWSFIKQQVDAHIVEFENGHRGADDFVFAYLEEMERRKDADDAGFFSIWQLRMLLLDLFFAGMETTVTTLKWAFLLMITNPTALKKAQEELDALGVAEVVLCDKARTPYTLAVISEFQRVANILPINLLRSVSTDVHIDGYFFKKGTLVIPQISIMLNDETVFTKPDCFIPERFLDEFQRPKKIEEFMPFSLGRRQCLGESLARAELFLVFANIIKNFDILPIPGETYDRKRTLGLTVSPAKYRVAVKRRKYDANMNEI